ncbi:MAG: winged helix-turn-helix domain-containing protein [Gammaproteobacteria bacterium]
MEAIVVCRRGQNRDAVVEQLRKGRIEVPQVTDGSLSQNADVVVVCEDMMRRNIVPSGENIPIIVMISNPDNVDRFAGLVDDYIVPPFVGIANRARFALAKRLMDRQPTKAARFSGWVLDFSAHELYSPNGKLVHLTMHQFDLMRTLITRSNQAISREELLLAVTGRTWRQGDRSIDVLVGKVRKKVTPSVIKTVRGIGYKFAVPVELS